MKKILLFFLVAFNFSNTFGQNQMLFHLNLGSNATGVFGTSTSNYNINGGYHFGLGMEYVFSNPLGLKVEFLLEKKKFNSIENKIIPLDKFYYKFIKYTNDVELNSFRIPVNMNYHYKFFSIEYGPYFDILYNSYQKEMDKEVWNDGSLNRTNYYYNRHSLTKFSIGVNIGININLYKGFILNTNLAQSFSDIGKEYSWKKLSTLNFSLNIPIGKKYQYQPRERKSNFDNESFKKFYLTYNYGFINVNIRKVSIGNSVVILLNKINNNYEIINVVVDPSSGFVLEKLNLNHITISEVSFPFKGKVKFLLRNRIDSSEFQPYFEFEISEDGLWNVTPIFN